MAVDLYDYTTSLKREVNPPGTDLFSSVTDEELVGYMADAFWEASLDGFFETYTCDEDGLITPVTTGGEDIPRAEIAVILLYAGIRIIRNRILNTNTTFRAKAGSVEFEQQSSAQMLSEMLKQLKAQKEYLLTKTEDGGTTPTSAVDALSVRSMSWQSYWGGPDLLEY